MEFLTLLVLGIIVLFVLLILTAFGFLVYCGILHDVKVSVGKPPIGQFTGAYKFQRGPYKDTSYTFTEATSLGPKLKLFGIYYDDPKKVPAEKLRWAVGCVLAEDDQEPDPVISKLFTSNGYKVMRFPAISNAVMTAFPFMSGVSIWLATFKMYPAIGAYIEEKKLNADPWMEIYYDSQIHFMAPLSKQLEFHVPEAGESKKEQ